VIGRSAISYLIVALILPLAAGSAWAQARPSSGSMMNSPYGGAVEAPAPSPSAPQGQNPFSGSVAAKPVPGVLQLSLQEAIKRGLQQNLGLLLSGENVRAARGERWKDLSELLPNVNTSTYIADSQIDLAEFGFTFKAPGFQVPSVVGPFSYFDSRAYLTQSVFDWEAINRTRAAAEGVKSAQSTYKDARDLVILAVG
jgi:outer membrane protein TolC